MLYYKYSIGDERNARVMQIFYIIIKMIFSDNDQHHKLHFHVYYAEHEASVGVDGELLARAYR